MGRIYAVAYAGTVTNAGGNTDLLELNPADDKPCVLRGMSFGNYSEFGDAAEEAIRINVQRFPATVTTGNGTAVTGAPVDSADAAAGFSAECNGTTVATTSGTAIFLAELAWNIRNSPFDFWWPDARFAPKAKQGEAIIVRMESTLADDASLALTFWVEEE